MELITSNNLTFSYDNKVVVEKINFKINKGDYVCIIGENGAGKSTLIKGLLKLKKPSSGQLIFENNLKSNEIGYLPQQNNYQKDFPATVKEVVFSGYLNKLGLKPFYSKNDKDIIYDNMKKMNIFDIRKKCFRDLSGGQQQRVLLARALCSTSKVILLDEPTVGLDPIVTKEFYDIVDKINKELKITIIMVSHDIKYAIKYASHILHIQKKQLFFGKTKDYLDDKICKTFINGGEL
ncbi:MAG: metal ABC transporter ATP-binding protein [Lachnospirales bacterium]|nr:metal ABC transporter ATP-binding protein [Clostridiales bacterium]